MYQATVVLLSFCCVTHFIVQISIQQIRIRKHSSSFGVTASPPSGDRANSLKGMRQLATLPTEFTYTALFFSQGIPLFEILDRKELRLKMAR